MEDGVEWCAYLYIAQSKSSSAILITRHYKHAHPGDRLLHVHMHVLLFWQSQISTNNHLLWQRILQALARFQFEELADDDIEGHHCRLGLGPDIIPVTDIH